MKPRESDHPNPSAAPLTAATRDHPPPYADPWHEERWTDEADRASFRKIYELFAYARESDE